MDSLLQSCTDPQLQQLYQARRQLLLLEARLVELQGLCQRYQHLHRRPPARLDDLLQAGLLDSLPEDPLGGSFQIDADGQVTSQHEALRLRPFSAAPPQPGAAARGMP